MCAGYVIPNEVSVTLVDLPNAPAVAEEPSQSQETVVGLAPELGEPHISIRRRRTYSTSGAIDVVDVATPNNAESLVLKMLSAV